MVHDTREVLEQLLLIPDVKQAVQANSILDEKKHTSCDHQYTTALYNGKDLFSKLHNKLFCFVFFI